MTLPETPVVDRDRGPTLRVLIHGAPYSGKTTTARTLGERLGQAVETPEEDDDGRTVLFDWMEYVGGRYGGGPIHTQLVTVPGHDPERRAHLLRDADVVLFVVDTRSEAMKGSAEMLEEVREHLRDRPDTVGLVIQANKRDDPTALPIHEVTSALALTDEDVVIETVASDGSGVRQAFVYAVRLGLQHVAARSDEDVRRASSPEELLAELRSTSAVDEIDEVDEVDEVEEVASPAFAETAVEPEHQFERAPNPFPEPIDDRESAPVSSEFLPPAAEPPIAEPPIAEPSIAEPPIAEPSIAEWPVAQPPAAEPAPRLLDTLLATQPRGERDLTERLLRECIDRTSPTDESGGDGPGGEEPPRLRNPLWRWLRG